MTDTDIGKGIAEREKAMGYRISAGPADSSIFDALPGKTSPAEEMNKHGATFVAADKSPGSRKPGWEIIRRLLQEAAKDRPEAPGMWVVDTCRQFIRTIPTLPRSDRDPDDADTNAEDHIADEVRYRCLATRHTFTIGTVSW